jgi:hypothetical protein
MRYILVLITQLIVAVPSFAADMFPLNGDHVAELFVMGMPKESEEIGQRMQRALATDPEWLKSYLEEKRPKPGEVIPYHEKFGISKEEYGRFVQSIGKLSLNRLGNVMVRVKKVGAKVVISIEGAALPVNVFEFSADGELMTCALGSTADHHEIDQSDASAPTGKWRGRQWSLQQGEADVSRKGTKGQPSNFAFARV